jgi:hypothetical protein
MAKGKIIDINRNRQQTATNKYSRLVRLVRLPAILALLLALITYAWLDSDEIPNTDVISEYLDKSSLQSPSIIQELHSKIFAQSKQRKEISEMSLSEISEIHHYLCIERWNSGGDIGMRQGTDYNSAAETLNIPVSKLEAADNYYHYQFLSKLTDAVKTIYKDHPNIVIDYYHPLTPTAYCGLNTIVGGITIYGQKKDIDFKEEAKSVAIEFVKELPEWVTGFKLHYTRYKDPVLQTEGNVDIGFLWRRGEDIQIMPAHTGTYGYSKPTENPNWPNDEWNNMKVIEHPSYTYLKPQ